MTYVIDVHFQFRLTETGERIFTVTRREGSTGDCPFYETCHESHFVDSAIKENAWQLRRAKKDFYKREKA